MSGTACNRRRAAAPRHGRSGALDLFALLLLLLACGGEAESLTSAQQREWAALQRTRGELVAMRGELAGWRQRLVAPPAGAAGADQGEQAAPADELAARVAAREAELARLSDGFGSRLVAFVAELDAAAGRAAPVKRAAPAERAAALRLKSDEDIEVALEWIERGGDYRRAIEILETQRRHDPGYPRLERALADARAMRQVTAERFARVSKGMTAAQVRAVLGPVNLHMVRSYREQGVEAWLYPKQGGGTAGVFFRRDGSGADGSGADGSGGDFDPGAGLVVYTTSFDLRPGAADGTEPREADGGLSTAGLSGG